MERHIVLDMEYYDFENYGQWQAGKPNQLGFGQPLTNAQSFITNAFYPSN
jgi:hypothetical protein